MDFPERIKNSKVYLIDIAGTSSSLGFVQDILFPFVINNVRQFLQNHWKDKEIIEIVSLFKNEEAYNDMFAEDSNDLICLLSERIQLATKENNSSVALKKIQGLIYKNGYSSGKLKGHVFEDVPEAFKLWKSHDKRICVYSTGSIESQRLLFENTKFGDLTEYIFQYYDQGVGLKIDSKSYENIAKDLQCATTEITFLTDLSEEAEAARRSGVNAVLVLREGNAPVSPEKLNIFAIKSFLELPINSS